MVTVLPRIKAPARLRDATASASAPANRSAGRLAPARVTKAIDMEDVLHAEHGAIEWRTLLRVAVARFQLSCLSPYALEAIPLGQEGLDRRFRCVKARLYDIDQTVK